MLAVAERAAQARPGENSRLVIWARLERNEPEEAIALARRQAQGGDPDAVDMLTSVLQWQLRLAESEVEARKQLAPGIPPDQRVEAWHALAKISLLQGRETEALSRLRAGTDEKASRAKAIHAWDTYTMLAILHHDRRATEQGLAAIERLGCPRAPLRVLPGVRRRARVGRAARSRIPPASLASTGRPTSPGTREIWSPPRESFRRRNFTYELAQVLAAQGRDADVVAVLVRRPSTYWMSIPETWILARYRVLLARALHRLGRDEEARAELERFLEPLERPDSDWLPLVEARALKAELAQGSRISREAMSPVHPDCPARKQIGHPGIAEVASRPRGRGDPSGSRYPFDVAFRGADAMGCGAEESFGLDEIWATKAPRTMARKLTTKRSFQPCFVT